MMQDNQNNHIFWIGNCPVAKFTKQELLEHIEYWIKNDSKNNYIIPVNLSKISMMQKDKKLADCIINSNLNIADGFSIVIAARILGENLPGRITGIELFEALLQMSNNNGFSIYLLGAKAGVIENCVRNIRIKYPRIVIAGYHHGYFENDEIKAIIADVNSSQAQILFVGLGLPQKEYFIYDHFQKLETNVIIAVGGVFDVIAGIKKRAPVFIQNIGAEWLWRSFYDRTRFILVLKNIWIFGGLILNSLLHRRIKRSN